MPGCTDRPDDPGSLRTRCAPLGAAQADTLERGELLLDWIKDYNYAAAPPRHLRHRQVAAAQSHDSDGDGSPSRPGYGLPAAGRPLVSPTRHSPASRRAALGRAAYATVDPVNGPQAAGSRLCPSLPTRWLLLLTRLGSDGDALALATPATGYSAIPRFARWSAGRGIGWQRIRVCRLGGVFGPLALPVSRQWSASADLITVILHSAFQWH
jgi:hypothetical protein